MVLVEHPWCFVKKFTDTQLRAASYKVRFDECYRVSSEVKETVCNSSLEADSDDDVHIPPEAPVPNSPTPPEVPQVLQPSPPTPSPQRLSTGPQRQQNPPKYLEYEQCQSTCCVCFTYTLWTVKNIYINKYIYRDEEEERSHAILYVSQL